jgi:hypothetical protein
MVIGDITSLLNAFIPFLVFFPGQQRDHALQAGTFVLATDIPGIGTKRDEGKKPKRVLPPNSEAGREIKRP